MSGLASQVTYIPGGLNDITIKPNPNDILLKNYTNPITNSGAVGNAAMGALSGIQSGMANYNAIDSSAVNNQLDTAGNFTVNAFSNNDLIDQINSFSPEKTDYNYKDMGFNWVEQLANVGSAALSGLSVGGPWGALAGGVIGAAGSIAAGIKAGNQAKKMNAKAELTNVVNENKMINAVDALDAANDMNRKLMAAEGGPLMIDNNNLNFINAGGTHEQNPLGGVPQGVAPDGSQNLVEEGEVVYKDYVFSNRLKPSTKLKDKYKITNDKATFAEAVKELIKPYEETMDDPITKRYIESLMQEFTQAQEEIRMKNNLKRNNKFPDGGELLKYAPMAANALGLLQNVFTPADYTYANRIENAPKRTTIARPTLLTNRYNYTPTDYNYLASKSLGQAAATRASLLDTATNAGAARAGLLSADLNAQDAWANTLLKAREVDEARRLQAEQFNLGVDQFNVQVLNNASQIDAQLAEAFNQRQMQSLAQAAKLRMNEDQAKAASISTNLNALADNAYQLYKDSVSDDQFLMSLANSGVTFTPEQRKVFNKRFANVLFDADGKMIVKKCGGRIKRKGLTY